VSDLYELEWFKGLEGLRTHNERALWGVFAHFGRPGSYLDMGCGDGWLVYTARTAGVPVSVGVEVSPDAATVAPAGTEIVSHDLSEALDLGRKFDLVTSWEVAEHIEQSGADEFVRNLVRHVGRYLVFTAAVVGQGGYHHVNCQPVEYWRLKFISNGLRYLEQETEALRLTWRWTVGPLVWLPNNIQVFSVE
jgi:cyclopropane fatty-acyl-phospholipid synthase-like methyltransferase